MQQSVGPLRMNRL